MLPDIADIFRSGAGEARETFLQQIDRIVHCLGQIEHAINRLDTYEETRHIVSTVETDAQGAATLRLDRPRPGFAWKVERITTHVVNGVNSTAVVYSGAVSPGNAKLVIVDADFYADDIGAPIHVGSGSPLTFVFAAAPANAKVTAAVQVVEVRVD